MIWKQRETNREQLQALGDAGISEFFANLVSNRNFPDVRSKQDVAQLINSPLDLLEDPSNIANVANIAQMFCDASGKAVAVYGDYDVDGIVSSYMCKRLLLSLGAESVDVYIPNRMEDGYGLNPTSVKRFCTAIKKNYALIVVLDCGSSSRDQIHIIRQKLPQTKVVVIDHHIVDEDNFSSNADYVVNPRMGKHTPYCTGGLMYQMVRQCSTIQAFEHHLYLPYSAMTTIADVCDLVDSNRIIVMHGIKYLETSEDIGLQELFKAGDVKMDDCEAEDIAFRIAPMINASGRIEVAAPAFKLLMSQDRDEAKGFAKKLQTLNETRKKIQKKMEHEAEALGQLKHADHGLLLYSDDWNTGVVGIVASRMVEKFGVPAICFGEAKGEIKGSARSIGEINIKAVMDSVSDLFERYGGHEMAAGATLKREVLNEAAQIFDEAVGRYKEENGIGEPVFHYDLLLTMDVIRRINNDFCERLSKLGPFGHGNERPIFRINGIECKQVRQWSKNNGGFVDFDEFGLTCIAYGENLKAKMEDRALDLLISITRSFLDGERWAYRVEAFTESDS